MLHLSRPILIDTLFKYQNNGLVLYALIFYHYPIHFTLEKQKKYFIPILLLADNCIGGI